METVELYSVHHMNNVSDCLSAIRKYRHTHRNDHQHYLYLLLHLLQGKASIYRAKAPRLSFISNQTGIPSSSFCSPNMLQC